MLLPSLRWSLLLLFLLICISQLSEGKRGGGGGRSSSRGSSGARSSSKSSGRGFGGSKSSSKSSSSGKSWWSSKSSSSSSDGGKSSWWGSGSTKLSSSRTGGGFTSTGGSSPSYSWSSSNPRPSVTRDSVSRGLFSSSGSSGYYGSSYGCGFGGCGNTYVVYHHYPRSYYYSHRTTTTTPAAMGPNANQLSSGLAGGVVTKNFGSNDTSNNDIKDKGANDTLIFDYDDVAVNGTGRNASEILEIADPTRPLVIQDLAFFWDAKYLPSEDAQGCVSFSPANSNSSISYCDVKEYSRCSRNLIELPGFLPANLFFPDGTAPSRLAWMCPAGTGCCDWECCSEGTGWGFVEIAFVILLTCVVLYYTGRCALYCFESCKEERYQRKMKEETKLLRDNEA